MKYVSLLAAAWGMLLPAADFRSNWPDKLERPWPGPQYWSNPMQDWRVRAGRLECFVPGGDRNVYLLTHDVNARSGDLRMSVRLGQLDSDELQNGFVGFRAGIRGDFNDYRDSAVRGEGLNAGLTHDGRLFIGSIEGAVPAVRGRLDNVQLRFVAEPAGNTYRITLAVHDTNGAKTAEIQRAEVPADWLTGGVALVSHSGPIEPTPPRRSATVDPGWPGKRYVERGGTMKFWFRDWTVSGSKVDAFEDRAWGPILWAMHTLHRGVLKLTAQMAPVEKGSGPVLLQVRGRTIAKSEIDPLSRTATFRIARWNHKVDTPYSVVFGSDRFTGTIRRNPVDKPQIVVAAFTGNNDLGFPHNDIVKHVSVHKPDLLAYTGDNIYERVAEYGVQRQPLEAATLDYLRKWYQFGWEYRDLLRDIPSVSIPDDHDVYHGNIWGAGGKKAEGEGQPGQDSGGYTMPAEWVNMVQRTQTSHMADPYDPTPVQQNITVYYGPMEYGGISFAVLEDRKWKSAPKMTIPSAKIVNGWPQNPDYNAAKHGDVEGAELLGKRQEDFLAAWAHDWQPGIFMKSVISQTIFAAVATLPREMKSDAGTPKLRIMQPGEYPPDELPTQDHDTNAWPQTPRNRALKMMRQALAFHIAGDQHLASTVQYGIDSFGDAGWAICVPSVANIFPRRWYPSEPAVNAKPGLPKNIGDFHDGFGNKVTVAAVANPTAVPIEPRALYDRAPGYGIVRFDRAKRTIEIANWPRWVDPSVAGSKPYDGWPITVTQNDNGLPKSRLVLEEVKSNTADPVIQVVRQDNNEIVYTFRINGRSFVPPVREDGLYTVRLNGRVVYKDRRPTRQ